MEVSSDMKILPSAGLLEMQHVDARPRDRDFHLGRSRIVRACFKNYQPHETISEQSLSSFCRQPTKSPAETSDYDWPQHCRGLFHTLVSDWLPMRHAQVRAVPKLNVQACPFCGGRGRMPWRISFRGPAHILKSPARQAPRSSIESLADQCG